MSPTMNAIDTVVSDLEASMAFYRRLGLEFEMFPRVDTDLRPGQRAEPAEQRGLVRVGRHHIVPAALMQVAGVPAVGVHRVGADQHLVQVELVEHRGERGDLAALRGDLHLAEHRPTGLVDHRHQVRLIDLPLGVPGMGAAHGLTVQGPHAPLLPRRCGGVRDLGAELGQCPDLQRRLQRRGVDLLQDPSDRRLVRHHTDPERLQHRVAGVVGVLRDRDERPRPGRDRARPDQQHRQHAVAHPTRRARIRNGGQGFDQRQHHRTGTRVDGHRTGSDLHMIEGSTDRQG
jgi:hypothetical protein